MGLIEKLGLSAVVIFLVAIFVVAFATEPSKPEERDQEAEITPDEIVVFSCEHEKELFLLRRENEAFRARERQLSAEALSQREQINQLLDRLSELKTENEALKNPSAEDAEEKEEFERLMGEVKSSELKSRAHFSEEKFGAMLGALVLYFPRVKAMKLAKLYLELRAHELMHDPDPDSSEGILAEVMRSEGFLPDLKPRSPVTKPELNQFARAGVLAIVGEEGLKKLTGACAPPATDPNDPMSRISWSLGNKLAPWASFLFP